MLIDFHHHLPVDPPCPYTEAYAEAIEEVAAEFGIDYVCINAVGPQYDNRTNDECLDLSRRCAKVIPFARVYPDTDKPEAVRRYAGSGFRGLKFISPLRNYDDDAYMPIYEMAAGCNLPCLFHTGFVGTFATDREHRVSSARMRPVYLETIARRFPSLTIVGAHLGAPWVEEAASTMAYNDNVFFDLSGGVASKSPDLYQRDWVKPFRWEKIVFGSDSMIRDFHVPYTRQRQVFAAVGVPDHVQRRILGDTVAGWLGLL